MIDKKYDGETLIMKFLSAIPTGEGSIHKYGFNKQYDKVTICMDKYHINFLIGKKEVTNELQNNN